MFKKLFSKLKTNMLQSILAKVLEKFKTSNPKIWLAVVFVLTLLHFGVTIGDTNYSLAMLLELLKVAPETAQEIASWVTWLFNSLVGASTYAFLNEKERTEKRAATEKTIAIRESKAT